jgi:hypothetical protein
LRRAAPIKKSNFRHWLASTAVAAAAVFSQSATAAPMARFDLSCVACATGGTFTTSWTTPFAANTAPGYVNWANGLFFRVLVPSDGITFWGHTAAYGGGYNFFDGSPLQSVAMASGSSSVLFDGPTSAPVWRVGTYNDVVTYFQAGTNQGRAQLRISAVPEPATAVLLLAAVGGLATTRRRRSA